MLTGKHFSILIFSFQVFVIILVQGIRAEPNWVQIDIEDPPPRMEAHNMVFDAARGHCVVFEGYQFDIRARPLYVYDGIDLE